MVSVLLLAAALARADDVVDRYERAWAYARDDDWPAAIAWYRHALALDPAFAPARLGLARAALRMAARESDAGMIGAALAYYEEALGADPRLAADPTVRARMEGLRAALGGSAPVAPVAAAVVPAPAPPPAPRAGRTFGVGIGLGLPGVLGVQGSAHQLRVLVPTVTVAPLLATVDVSAHLVPLRTRWSPALGGGVTWGYLESTFDTDELLVEDRVMVAHGDVGVDYQAPSGFRWTFALTVANLGDGVVLPLPSTAVGWAFARQRR